MQNIVLGCNGVMAAPSLAPISALFSTGDLISRRPLSTFGPLFPATLSVQRPLSTPLSFLQAPPLSSLCSSCSIERRDTVAMSSSSYTSTSPEEDPDMAKLAQVSKRLENTSRYFKRLGSLGFWSQLVCTVVAAVILSFSAVVSGKVTSPATFYATAGGIAAAFLSVFWSFGYIRLSDKLWKSLSEPAKAPPRAEVVKRLRNGIVINVLGMGATVLGMQATIGLLVAKALTSSATPYYQGLTPGYSPVLALDVFLVQACANTVLSHFLGLIVSLELLRSVTSPSSEAVVVPKVA
ncbi:protein TIC 21, chloroplastic [Amborella trichopoda]|uniref:protein TIC 21, chloroplastic n=1 Tax=Amborella trichopoda TaxID=13333 RepID=UPI0005D3CC12|nr:protein TIC 21, chloroplastic [Amborella trichopoda]|eukprot:XP_011623218.1 protein TIC 21, chloroplastic [Amborella trichopoda]